MTKRGRRPARPYTQMRRAVEAGYRRRLWLVLLVVYSVVTGVGVSAQILSQGSPWLTTALAALLAIGVMIILGAGLILLLENLQHSENEDAAIERGIDFLREHGQEEHVLTAIERRADRGSDAMQIRISLPILLLTLVATVSNLLSLVPPTWQPSVYMLIILVALTLLREVGRANTDVVILSAIDEYRAEAAASRARASTAPLARTVPQLLPASQQHRAPRKRRNIVGPNQRR